MAYRDVVMDMVDAGDRMKNSAYDAVSAKAYCAASEVYCRFLENNLEEAEFMYNSFREQNNKIFEAALKILDRGIDTTNVGVVSSAMQLISIMKKTYPAFYKAYYTTIFGNGRKL